MAESQAVANREELIQRIKLVENSHTELTDLAGQLGTWYETQKLNVFGRLISHLDSEIAKAAAELDEQNQELKIGSIPEEQLRIGYRKKFHSKILRRFRFNFAAVAILLGINFIMDFLDAMKFWSPIGPIIYYILGPLVAVAVLIFVLVRRAQKGKEKWPGKRIAKWIAFAVIVGAVIAFWPFAGFWVRLATKTPFWPSAWSIIAVAMGLFLWTFIRALLQYHAEFRDYFDSIRRVHELLKWARRGSLNVRTSIRRLELVRKQVQYWNLLLGFHLRNPWRVPTKDAATRDWRAFSASFPPSIRVAEALERSGDGSRRPLGIERIVNEVAESESAQGWRTENFNRILKTAAEYSFAGSLLADNIDRDSPSAPNGSREELLKLVQDQIFLELVGSQKCAELIGGVQDKVLEAADLDVEAVQPRRGQDVVQNWDDHLGLAIDEENLFAHPLADFAIRQSSLVESHTNSVVSFIVGPKRIIESVEGKRTKPVPDSVSLLPLTATGQRSIDLVLRLDLAGVHTPIPANAVILPDATATTTPSHEHEGYCYNCGRPDCVSVTSGADCPVRGV